MSGYQFPNLEIGIKSMMCRIIPWTFHITPRHQVLFMVDESTPFTTTKMGIADTLAGSFASTRRSTCKAIKAVHLIGFNEEAGFDWRNAKATRGPTCHCGTCVREIQAVYSIRMCAGNEIRFVYSSGSPY